MSVCDLVFPLGYKLHVNRDAVSFVSAAPSVCKRVWHSVGAQPMLLNKQMNKFYQLRVLPAALDVR